MQNKDDSHRPCFALFRRVGTLFAAQFKDIRSRHLRATLTEGGKLLRRVGTLLAVQFKDILSRHLRATLPKGESFFSRRCASLSPKGKAFSLGAVRHSPRRGKQVKKLLIIIKRLRFYLFDRSATFLYFIVFTAPFLNAISLIYRLIAACLPFNCKIRTSMRLLYLQNISGYLAS